MFSNARIRKLLDDIRRGSTADASGRGSIRSTLVDEDGLMSWATLVAVVCFVALVGIVFNVGRIANDKLEAQNAADSVAYSTSLVQARSMNALCATNHMIGELSALYMIHHSIGGQVLDNGDTKSPPFFLSGFVINTAYWLAEASSWGTLIVGGTRPESVGVVDSTPRGEATVYDAACLLKFHMLAQYANHLSGSALIYEGMATSWFFGAGLSLIEAGIAEQYMANAMMMKIKQEYQVIRALEDFALATRPMKPALKACMKALDAYATANVEVLSRLGARQAATMIGDKNRCVGEALGRPDLAGAAMGALAGASVRLPVVEETTSNEKKSQVLRATYPWVREWRSSLLIFLDASATLSRAARFYEFHSDRYSLEKCSEFRAVDGLKLYVMDGMDPNQRDKGREIWVTDSGKADDLFCVVGLARQTRVPRMSHTHFLPQTNSTAVMGLAQSLLYNANPQDPHRSQLTSGFLKLSKPSQPTVGWDTLNWTRGAADWKNGKSYMDFASDSFRWFTGLWVFMDFAYPPDYNPDTPRISLNWQAKLVPVADTRLYKRALHIQDSGLRTRFQKQVLPAAVAQKLGVNLINH